MAPQSADDTDKTAAHQTCCYSEYLAFAQSCDPYAHVACCADKDKHITQGDIERMDDPAYCPAMQTMEMLSGKWRLKVLFRLTLKPSMRFSELKKSIPGITSAMLTTALRELESYGVVSRRQFEEIPPRVEYSLTESGHDLYPVFYEMARWAVKYLK